VAAAAPADSERIDLVVAPVNACNGDLVVTQGELHTVTHTNSNGSIVVHYNYHGTGTGVPSGTEYEFNVNEKLAQISGQIQETFFTRLISKGQSENQLTTLSFGSSRPPTFTSRCAG
jgi:hypothetical protein